MAAHAAMQALLVLSLVASASASAVPLDLETQFARSVADLLGVPSSRELLAFNNSSMIVPQTQGFGDHRLPSSVPLPPAAAGGGLPVGDMSAYRFAGTGQDELRIASKSTSSSRVASSVNQINICNSIRLCSGKMPLQLRGVNWFGFETSTTMVDGLYQGPTALTLDFITVLRRIKLLGFNAIRLPFSMKVLFDTPPLDFRHNCPDGNIGNPTAQGILDSVLKPGVNVGSGYGSVQLRYVPHGKIPLDGSRATCNSYLPNTNTLARFLWVVGVLARNNFVVMIDNHLNLDTSILDNYSQWKSRWMTIARGINNDPYARKRVIFDILNEPDSYGLKWEPSSNPQSPSMTKAYLDIMTGAYAINKNFLFAIEGLGQLSTGANWGDGLATDPSVIRPAGASDPNPFFRQLLKEPFRKNVIIAPHIYPPSITIQSNNYLNQGAGLYARLSKSFGYLNKQGYCFNGSCQKFPIVIGEFGSRLRDCRNRCANFGCLPTELEAMQSFINYLNYAGDAKDGKHEQIDSWMWWAWNSNSGDTGGLVQDNWSDIIWQKITYLGSVGLRPWYSKKCSGNCYTPLSQKPLSGCNSACGLNGKSCSSGHSCINGLCCARERTCNQNTCCAAGSVCLNSVCCPVKKQCGNKCCASSQSCHNGKCVAASSIQRCGGTICPKTGACSTNKAGCCPSGKSCNNSCCAGSRTCKMSRLLNRKTCCARQNTCGKYCCGSMQKCLGGKCCSKHKVCGAACCAKGQGCRSGKCVAVSTSTSTGK